MIVLTVFAIALASFLLLGVFWAAADFVADRYGIFAGSAVWFVGWPTMMALAASLVSA